jgi:hypothetical protein
MLTIPAANNAKHISLERIGENEVRMSILHSDDISTSIFVVKIDFLQKLLDDCEERLLKQRFDTVYDALEGQLRRINFWGANSIFNQPHLYIFSEPINRLDLIVVIYDLFKNAVLALSNEPITPLTAAEAPNVASADNSPAPQDTQISKTPAKEKTKTAKRKQRKRGKK